MMRRLGTCLPRLGRWCCVERFDRVSGYRVSDPSLTVERKRGSGADGRAGGRAGAGRVGSRVVA